METTTKNKNTAKPNTLNTQQVQELITQRRKFLASLIDEDKDIIVYGNHRYKKKSYWRKLAVVANISLRKLEEWKEVDHRGVTTYFFTMRASLPNQQFADATGACTQDEKGNHRTIHDTRATAETRAKNRAISDLFGFGEVSAEEIFDNNKKNNNKTTKAITKISESDEEQSLLMIEKLATVLPGSAENLISKNTHKMQSPQLIELTIRKIIAFEMSELNQQGFITVVAMKNLAESMFNAKKFNSLSIAQSVELLNAILKIV